MQIKNVTFNKGDFRFTIDYFDGKDVTKLSTNDEPLSSLQTAIDTLIASTKKWCEIGDGWNVALNAVKFGKNEDSPSSVQITANSGMKMMGIITRVPKLNKNMTFPDEVHVSMVQNVKELQGEIDRFLRGERAQKELPFEEVAANDE